MRHPLGWMLTGVVGIGLVSGVTATGPGPVPVLGAVAALGVYWAVMRKLVRRAVPEVYGPGVAREALRGGAVGLVFVLVSVLVVAVFGGYSFSWADNGIAGVVTSVVMVQIGTAVTEELMFRGLAFQALEKLWGSSVAVAGTALFFGGSHLLNPGATLWSGLAIAVEAGVLLGAAFLWRRSIWFVVGLHFAWNTTETLLGIPVSGHTIEGVLSTQPSGPPLLTGGVFGLEASAVPVVGLALAVPMFVLARRRGAPVTRRQTQR
ncbi:CPBP family intramembrane glutamic endopeptidase [Streptomyces sp. NPDC006879]|uniref:CPBP family intramembrane glutamic endopeptidase n=1 Tax=Streptomyces sp. NPDC006879 TaxID=3364767 RepID=UPI003688C2EA